MKVNQSRSLLVYIILTFVTCGIYPLYFIYSFAKDVNIMCAGDGKNTSGLLMFIILSTITCGIYGIYWWYAVAERIGNAQANRGVAKDIDGGKYLLWSIIGYLTTCVILSLYATYLVFKGANSVAAMHNAEVDGYGASMN